MKRSAFVIRGALANLPGRPSPMERFNMTHYRSQELTEMILPLTTGLLPVAGGPIPVSVSYRISRACGKARLRLWRVRTGLVRGFVRIRQRGHQ